MILEYKEIHFSNLLHSDRLYLKGEKLKVSHLYLTFSISKRYNNLTKDLSQWTTKQEEIHSLIKSLQDKGLGYRKISHYLNTKKIKTKRNTTWTNSKVHSYLKRYKEKTKRQNYRKKFYEMKWIDRMKLKF